MPKWESVPGVQSSGITSPGMRSGLFRCHGERLHGPIDFPPGIGDRFPRFSGHHLGEFLAPIVEQPAMC